MRNREDDVIWEKIKNVPKLSRPLAAFCSLFNLIIPGSGTVTAACLTEEQLVSKTQLLVGVIQFMLSFLVIGFFLSWYWAYLLFAKSLEIGEFDTNRPTPTPPTPPTLPNVTPSKPIVTPTQPAVSNLNQKTKTV